MSRTFLLVISSFLTLLFLSQSCSKENIALLNDPTPNDTVCFKKTILPLTQNYCATSGCHNSITHEEGLDLSTYAGIMKIVSAGQPLDSKFFTVLVRSKDRMPPNATFSDDKKILIQRWITQGAIDANCQ